MDDDEERRHFGPSPPFRIDPYTEMRTQVTQLMEDIDERVTLDQFDPIKRLVYGMVAVILLGFMAGLITLVIRSGKGP